MEVKSARLTFLIEPSAKSRFERICSSKRLKASEVARSLIEEYINSNTAQETSQEKRFHEN